MLTEIAPCEICGAAFVRPARWVKRPLKTCSRSCASKLSRRNTRLPTLAEKFWRKVTPGPGCWHWQGSCFKPHGYGNLSHENRTVLAHRVSWMVTRGEIPPGLWVLHKCDNPPCVRPDHLYVGTPRDNSRDKVVRGRHRCGEKLTAEQVVLIRLAGRQYPIPGTIAQLAKICGVAPTTVSDVLRGRTWRKVVA